MSQVSPYLAHNPHLNNHHNNHHPASHSPFDQTTRSPDPYTIHKRSVDALHHPHSSLLLPAPQTVQTPPDNIALLLHEARQHRYGPEELQAALLHCGTDHPVDWLRQHWPRLCDTVQTLATRFGQHAGADNRVGVVSATEARDALLLHRGQVAQAVTECVQQRQTKWSECMARGPFDSGDVLAALSAHQGQMNGALLELSSKWPATAAPTTTTAAMPWSQQAQPNDDNRKFVIGQAGQNYDDTDAASEEKQLNDQSISSPEPISLNSPNMLRDIETLIGNMERNHMRQNEDMMRTIEVMLRQTQVSNGDNTATDEAKDSEDVHDVQENGIDGDFSFFSERIEAEEFVKTPEEDVEDIQTDVAFTAEEDTQKTQDHQEEVTIVSEDILTYSFTEDILPSDIIETLDTSIVTTEPEMFNDYNATLPLISQVVQAEEDAPTNIEASNPAATSETKTEENLTVETIPAETEPKAIEPDNIILTELAEIVSESVTIATIPAPIETVVNVVPISTENHEDVVQPVEENIEQDQETSLEFLATLAGHVSTIFSIADSDDMPEPFESVAVDTIFGTTSELPEQMSYSSMDTPVVVETIPMDVDFKVTVPDVQSVESTINEAPVESETAIIPLEIVTNELPSDPIVPTHFEEDINHLPDDLQIVESPELEKTPQNLSEMVNDTQKLIQQMRDELNSDIATFTSEEEDGDDDRDETYTLSGDESLAGEEWSEEYDEEGEIEDEYTDEETGDGEGAAPHESDYTDDEVPPESGDEYYEEEVEIVRLEFDHRNGDGDLAASQVGTPIEFEAIAPPEEFLDQQLLNGYVADKEPESTLEPPASVNILNKAVQLNRWNFKIYF